MKLLILSIALAMAATLVPLAGAAEKPVVRLDITTVGGLSDGAVNFKFNIHNGLPVAKSIVVYFSPNLHPYGPPKGGKLEGEPGHFIWKVPNLATGLNRSIIIPLRSPAKPGPNSATGPKQCASARFGFEKSKKRSGFAESCFWWKR